jgi:multiple sugar transport system substrate-binding protein
VNSPDLPGTAISRRGALRAAALTGLTLSGLTACGRGFGGGDDDSGGKAELNMVWWGDATRAERTRKALDLFQRKHSGITVRTEYQDSTPYKDKLATRFAAGDPPDLMAMRIDSLREYADRGVLLDLAPHSDELDLSGLGDSARQLGTVDDKLFGVPSGLNAVGFIINRAVTGKYGVPVPDGDTWSWRDLADWARRVTEASGRKVYGCQFEPYTLANLLVFTRQRGEDLFTAAGGTGVSEATVTAWFELVEGMRAEGGFPPAGFIDQNVGSSAAQSYIAKGSVAAQIIPTNNLLNYNAACGGTLELLRMPGESQAPRRGQSVDTPALWSVSAKTRHRDATLTLLDFLINDVEGAKATGTTRGVPANRQVAEQIAGGLDRDDQRATEYLTKLQSEKLPPSYSYPIGASQLPNTLRSISTEVEFKRITPAAAARQFLDSAAKSLKK